MVVVEELDETWWRAPVLAVTETGSVIVVADEVASIFEDASAGERGTEAGTGGSYTPLLIDPALELAVLWGALAAPVIPLYIAEPRDCRDENEVRSPALDRSGTGGFRLISTASGALACELALAVFCKSAIAAESPTIRSSLAPSRSLCAALPSDACSDEEGFRA